MKKLKRMLSSILLLCMIFSMMPPVQFASAETPITYVLDTDGIDPGATYIIVRKISSWLGNSIVALDGSDTPGKIYSKLKENQLEGDQITYVDGFEALEWTVESYDDAVNQYSLVHKEADGNRYLDITGNAINHAATPAPLLISSTATSGAYVVAYQKPDGQYIQLQLLQSYSSPFPIASPNESYSLLFYKKSSTSCTLTFDGNGFAAAAPAAMTDLEQGKQYQIPAPNALQYEGDTSVYTFVSWCENKDGTGNRYEPGKMISITQNTTLYALWEKQDKYIVTVETKLDDVAQNMADIHGANTVLYLEKDGNQWLLNQTDTGIYTAAVTENGTYTVYAQKPDAEPEPTNCTVTVDGQNATAQLLYYSINYMVNGATFHHSVYPVGSWVTVINDAPTAEDNYFQGWEAPDGRLLHSGGVISTYLQEAIVLNAQWHKVGDLSYVIRYHEKTTEKELRASTTVNGVAVDSVILAEQVAQKILGYSYVGAGINGQFYDKEKNPSLVVSSEESKNVITVYYSPDPDLHLHKEATLENDGTYTIEMNMFTHNNPVTTLVNQDVPLDIVLVLDQSGSIFTSGVYEDLKTSVTTFINMIADHSRENEADHRLAIVGYGSNGDSGSTGRGNVAGSFDKQNGVTKKGSGTWANTGVFDAHGDFHVYPIAGFVYEPFTGTIPFDENGNPVGTYYTYSQDVGEYLVMDYHKVYRHLIPEHEAFEENLKDTDIYGYVDGEFVKLTRNSSGLWIYGDRQLYSSEKFFTRHEQVWTHRYGIDAREIHAYMVDGKYTPIEGHEAVFTRKETVDVPADQSNFKSLYDDALIPVTMGQDGSGYVDPVFTKAVDNLGASGETYISYGMLMANRIFEENPLTELDEDVERQRVIVVFTDGKPGDSSGFDELESNAALAQSAISTEEYGAVVYTIGLYGEEIVDAESDQDYFMNGLSSNYPNADSLDKVWLGTEMIAPQAGGYLNIGGPYYAKEGDNYYPITGFTSRDPNNKEDKTYYYYWQYSNGTETVTISKIANVPGKVQEHPVIQAVEEDGVVKSVVNGVEIFRKAGTGYQKASSSQYYSKTSDPTELEYYFASIVQGLTTKISEEIMLEDDTVLRDIMGQGLVLTPGTVISVSAQAGRFNPVEKKVDWLEEVIPLGELEIPENPDDVMESETGVTHGDTFIPYIRVYNLKSANPTKPNEENYHPHTVDISGYLYDKWYMNAEKLEGYRLVATITRIEATEDVVWGRATSTNHAQSGLWLPEDENGNRELLETFVQPTTAFVERAYVLDYGKSFELTGWYFDDEDGKVADAQHIDCEISNGMNWFDAENPHTVNGDTCAIRYGNVHIEDGNVFYTPVTTQWGGYDTFYVFGNTWRNTIVTLDANQNGNLWNKVTVIPANNIYYEDSFITGSESNGANGISGFTFTGEWKTDYTGGNPNNAGLNQENPEHMEKESFKDVHGWTDALADDIQYSDGSAQYTDQMGARVSFQFTGTGVDVYTRTNDTTGIVMAILTPVNVEGEAKAKSIIMDNLAMSGDYYQIPTLSFSDLSYGTYQVELIVTRASNVATGELRYRYYLDGIRVYNPLGSDMTEAPNLVRDAYGKELNAFYTEIRDIMLKYDDFTPDLADDGITGAAFIDWIRDGQQSGQDEIGTGKATYEVGTTFQTYGPKNEVYLSKGQAVVMKVDEKNTYYVGMKSLRAGESVTVNVSGLNTANPKTITVSHTTDMYYEVTPMDGYLVIKNGSEGDALLALTKLRTTNMHQMPADNGVQAVAPAEAISTMDLFDLRLAGATDAPETQEPAKPTAGEELLAKNKKLTEQLFTAVRTWLDVGERRSA